MVPVALLCIIGFLCFHYCELDPFANRGEADYCDDLVIVQPTRLRNSCRVTV